MIILGSTGMLGQALKKEADRQNISTIGVSRNSADVNLDVLNFEELADLILSRKPSVVINCVANTGITSCEENLGSAYMVNSHLVANLTELCRSAGSHLVQISTDHYYIGDLDRKHKEVEPISLVNSYAKTKFAGEQFALSYEKSLVVRTNIVGFRNRGLPTFIEWVVDSLKSNQNITLFQDFYTSSLDVESFARILFQIIYKEGEIPCGLINIASSDVVSKSAFIEKMSKVFGYKRVNFSYGSIRSMQSVKRAESLGLDVSKVEEILGEKMPTTDQVIFSLFKTWKENDKNQ